MKLFGKKKVEKQEALLERVMAEAMGKALAEKLMGEIKSDTKQVESALPARKNEVFEERYFIKTDNTSFVPDDITPTKVDDLTSPLASLKSELRKDEVQKRRYTKRNKEFWGSKKTAQQEPKEDTLRVFRQRSAAIAISPDDFSELAREGDVYYIPYKDDTEIGRQQASYTGRVSNRLRTEVATIYGVNSKTHKAENLMRIECY